MPIGRPSIGETWESADSEGRTVRGVVSEIFPTILTLVSVTGNRLRVAPERFLRSWTYGMPAPRTPFVCSRRGCTSSAVFRYSRGTSPDYVCPRHAPTGTHLEILGNNPTFEPPVFSGTHSIPIWCPLCSNPDPIEDRSLSTSFEIAAWACIRCNSRWFILQPGENRPFAWWTDAFQVALRELDRLRRPPNAVVLHPGTFADIRRDSSYRGEASPENAQDTLFGLRVIFAQDLDPNTVAVVRLDRETALNRDTPQETSNEAALPDSRSLGNSPAVLVAPKSKWLHKGTGVIVEVVSVRDAAVSFRQEDQKFHMLLDDFLNLHRPYVTENLDSIRVEPLNIPLPMDAEYESTEGTVKIVSVDSKRELVTVIWDDGRKRAPLSLREFATSKWRKIVRRTAYQRILDDEDDD